MTFGPPDLLTWWETGYGDGFGAGDGYGTPDTTRRLRRPTPPVNP